jgi:hypothetical protein
MKALTIYQPWATLIIEGLKPYEFRKWPGPKWVVGKRIAIHASARPVKRDEVAELLDRLERRMSKVDERAVPLLEKIHLSPGLLPLASVLGTAIMGEPKQAAKLFAGELDPNDSARIDHSIWAWPMLEIERLDVPVPARGAQGFWRWTPAEIAR